MRAKGLLSVVMTGAMMMGALSGCGFEPDITWTDTTEGNASAYKVTVVVAHDGKLSIKSEQTVKDDGTLNFIATPADDTHRISGIMVDNVVQSYKGTLPTEGKVKISLENINQDMTVVVLCDNENGGLGGVDGAVTGLDGTGDGDLGGGTPVNPGDDTPAATEYTVTFTADGGTHKAKATGTDDENPITFVDDYQGTGVATVEEGSDVDVIIEPLDGWAINLLSMDEGATGTENDDGSVTFDLDDVDDDVTIQYEYVRAASLSISGADVKIDVGGKGASVDVDKDTVVKKDDKLIITPDPEQGTVKEVTVNGSVVTPDDDGKYIYTIGEVTEGTDTITIEVEYESVPAQPATITGFTFSDVTLTVGDDGEYDLTGTVTFNYEGERQNDQPETDNLSNPAYGTVTYSPAADQLVAGEETDVVITYTYAKGVYGTTTAKVTKPVSDDDTLSDTGTLSNKFWDAADDYLGEGEYGNNVAASYVEYWKTSIFGGRYNTTLEAMMWNTWSGQINGYHSKKSDDKDSFTVYRQTAEFTTNAEAVNDFKNFFEKVKTLVDEHPNDVGCGKIQKKVYICIWFNDNGSCTMVAAYNGQHHNH